MAKGEPDTSTNPAAAAGFLWRPWAVVAALGFVITNVNATSVIIEWGRDHRPLDPREPFLWEYSSYVVTLCLAPLFATALRWLPPRRDNLVRFGLLHFGLSIAYSLVHVAGFVAIRKLAYAAVGGDYNFSDGNLPLTLLYEWRKDLIGYAIIATIYWYFTRAQPAPALTPDERIEIRDGAIAMFVPAREIGWIEAAGNYVEFHAGGRTHLVRGTLAAWEAKLSVRNFVRVHRSRLVNRARVRTVKPTASGDVEITLDDGAVIAGSRRYRSALESAASL
ncbi:MAG: LytTR family DNA-binding domain-containing protein [Terricaulis silvestris]